VLAEAERVKSQVRLCLENSGYVFSNFNLEVCIKAETIKDVVDAVWNDLESTYS
jgi:hypothetical protein